jgi:hypothetical protein
MAKIFTSAEPPISEIETAIKRINHMLARQRGHDAIAVKMLADSKATADRLLQQLRDANRRIVKQAEKS